MSERTKEHTSDLRALLSIQQDIAEIAAESQSLRTRMPARERGFFRPQEDDQIRSLWLRYRNHRLALYDLIQRHESASEQSIESLLLGFGAALELYTWSTELINRYAEIPLIREKLNEPEPRYEIPAGLFDDIYARLRNPQINKRLLDTIVLYREVLRARTPPPPAFVPLQARIDLLLGSAETELQSHHLLAAREVARAARGNMRQAARELCDSLRTWTVELVGNIWYDRPAAISQLHRRLLREQLQPGDLLIVRPEKKSSTAFLPGWWTHAAVFHGGPGQVRRLGLEWPGPGNDRLETIEALAAGVVFNTLARTLRVDHVVALRPKLSDTDRSQALQRALSHAGKPYDFSFDFRRSDRLVCTELVYRSYDQVGPLQLPIISRFGRPTLSADDIVAHARSSPNQFAVIALSSGNALLTGEQARAQLDQLSPCEQSQQA